MGREREKERSNLILLQKNKNHFLQQVVSIEVYLINSNIMIKGLNVSISLQLPTAAIFPSNTLQAEYIENQSNLGITLSLKIIKFLFDIIIFNDTGTHTLLLFIMMLQNKKKPSRGRCGSLRH